LAVVAFHLYYPFSDEPLDLILSEDLYLASGAYIDEGHWRAGWDDSLQNRRGVKVARIQVLKTDVVRWWPFGLAEAAAETSAVAPTSGAPGRPSSVHPIKDEHRARWERGDALTGVAAEARALHDWFREVHPNKKPPSARTIKTAYAVSIGEEKRPHEIKISWAFRASFSWASTRSTSPRAMSRNVPV
jgi:hypothetical protein